MGVDEGNLLVVMGVEQHIYTYKYNIAVKV